MTNRDLLKEAIADAKAVKEVAITNAKAALEEAFTPHLKEMFEKKLSEMEEEDELKEYAETQPDTDMDGDGDVDADDVKAMEESELEELLRELDEAEEDESEEEEGEEGEEEEVEIDLEDMTEEDLKKFIEEVVDEMIEAGELEAGHEGMEDEAGMEMEEPEMGAEEEVSAEEEMPMEEGVLNEAGDAIEIAKMLGVSLPIAKAIIGAAGISGSALIGKLGQMVGKRAEKAEMKEGRLTEASDAIEIAKLLGVTLPVAKAIIGAAGISGAALIGKLGSMLGKKADTTSESYKEEDEKMAAMEAELAEAMETINTLKSELNEINLLNSKLLYTNKIFKAKNLTEAQKVKVLTAFDKAESVKEVKLVFETLNEGLEKAAKKELVRESKGFASKPIGTSPKQPVVEVNPIFERMRKLAGL